MIRGGSSSRSYRLLLLELRPAVDHAHVSAPWPYPVAIHTITRAVLMHHFAGTFQRLRCAFPLQGISQPEAVPYGCTKHEDQRAIIKSRPRREPIPPRPISVLTQPAVRVTGVLSRGVHPVGVARASRRHGRKIASVRAHERSVELRTDRARQAEVSDFHVGALL